jgi:methyl-accepting chemotaxis protein
VRELSDRSGILAINASLEAARAGAGGAGFATVAREMKGLADRSREATQKVRQILGQVEKEISGVRAGVEAGSQESLEAAKLAGRAGETIAGLAEAIATSAGLASQIADGTREQSTDLEQIAEAIAESARALEATLDGTRRIEQEAGVLATLSGELGQQAR